MSPREIVEALRGAGVRVLVSYGTDGAHLVLKPTPAPDLLALVLQHRDEIIEWMPTATPPTKALTEPWPPSPCPPTPEQWEAHYETCFRNEMDAARRRAGLHLQPTNHAPVGAKGETP